ncbi:MAG: hypothetical protein M3Q87_06410 [Actinomycetota bacterium]|nr:hypothetical protein [Actinomycetota bacterium]
MDMMDTMPEVLIAAVVVLLVLGVALYLFVRVAGGRQVEREGKRGRVPRRRQPHDDEPERHR